MEEGYDEDYDEDEDDIREEYPTVDSYIRSEVGQVKKPAAVTDAEIDQVYSECQSKYSDAKNQAIEARMFAEQHRQEAERLETFLKTHEEALKAGKWKSLPRPA